MLEGSYPRWFNKLKGKTSAPESTQENPYPRLIAWLALIALISLFVSNLSHWFSIEILGYPPVITSEELDWLNQQTPAEQQAMSSARADRDAFSSLENAFFIFLLSIPLAITIVRIRFARK